MLSFTFIDYLIDFLTGWLFLYLFYVNKCVGTQPILYSVNKRTNESNTNKNEIKYS